MEHDHFTEIFALDKTSFATSMGYAYRAKVFENLPEMDIIVVRRKLQNNKFPKLDGNAIFVNVDDIYFNWDVGPDETEIGEKLNNIQIAKFKIIDMLTIDDMKWETSNEWYNYNDFFPITSSWLNNSTLSKAKLEMDETYFKDVKQKGKKKMKNIKDTIEMSVIKWKVLPTPDEIMAAWEQGKLLYFMNMISIPSGIKEFEMKGEKVMANEANFPYLKWSLKESYKFLGADNLVEFRYDCQKGMCENTNRRFDYLQRMLLFYRVKAIPRASQESPELVERMTTMITEGSIVDTAFDVDLVSIYERSRHNIMLNAIANILKLTEYDDIKLRDYFPDSNVRTYEMDKTPDIIISKEDIPKEYFEMINRNLSVIDPEWTHLMSDVAVVEDRMTMDEMKMTSYSEVCALINKKDNLHIVLVPFVFSLKDESSLFYSIFTANNEEIKDKMKMVKNRHNLAMRNDSFVRARQMKYVRAPEASFETLDIIFNEKFGFGFKDAYKDKNLDKEVDDYDPSLEELDKVHTDFTEVVREEMKEINKDVEDKTRKISPMRKKMYMLHSAKEIKKTLEKRENALSSDKNKAKAESMEKMSKAFKYPRMPAKTYDPGKYKEELTRNLNMRRAKHIDLQDGSVLHRVRYRHKDQKLDTPGYAYNPNVGNEVENLIELMSGESKLFKKDKDKMKEKMKKRTKDNRIEAIAKSFGKTKGSDMAMWFQKLSLEIMLLSGRRQIKKSKFGVSKCYDWGILTLSAGPKLTREKIVNFKVSIFEDSGSDGVPSMHTYYSNGAETVFKDSNMSESKWLAVTLADLEVFCRAYDRSLLLYAGLGTLNNKGTDQIRHASSIDKRRMMIPLMIMLSHKRNTSTSLQLNRFLYHSYLSIISNKVGIIEKIGELPMRDPICMWVTHRQLEWSKTHLANYTKDLLEVSGAMKENEGTPKADMFTVNSIFDENEIEAEEMVNEMYYGNLFNKDLGHITHRSKQIFTKVAEDEINMRKFLKDPQMTGKTYDYKKMIFGKDVYGYFSRDIVYIASKSMWQKYFRSFNIGKMASRLTSSVIDTMKMTSSVDTGLVETMAGLKKTKNEGRKPVKVTQLEVAYEKGSDIVAEIAMLSETIDIYMGSFPKAAVGGSREIMIQDKYCRPIIRIVETIFTVLNEDLPMEMITEGDSKHISQANMFERLEESASSEGFKSELRISNNTDQSHWAPSINLLQFTYMVKAMGFGPNMKGFIISVFKAFANKKMALPPALVKSWSKISDYEESDPNLNILKEEASENNWTVKLVSGMGQGMLHATSSYYHCVEWNYCREIMTDNCDLLNVSVNEFVQLSSDDKTEYKVVRYNNVKSLMKYCYIDLLVRHSVDRAFNIHFNDKKSGLNLFLSEFNSVFMVGKRMLAPYIKDLFTCLDLVDTSKPEGAVRAYISSESRLLTNGATYTCSLMARVLNSIFLTFLYRTNDLMDELMATLNCGINQLPYTAGFMSCDLIYESLLLGPEVYMVEAVLDADELLLKHYSAVYSHNVDQEKSMRVDIVTENEIAGRIFLNLQTRKDEKLENLVNDLKIDKDRLKVELESRAYTIVMSPVGLEDMRLRAYNDIAFNTSSYDLFDRVRLDAMVRALSMPSKSATFNGILPYRFLDMETPEVLTKHDIEEKWKMLYPEGLSVTEFIDFTLRNDMNRVLLDKLFFYPLVAEVVIFHREKVKPMITKASPRRGVKVHKKMRKLTMRSSKFLAPPSMDEVLKYLFNPLYMPRRAISVPMTAFFNSMGLKPNATYHDIMNLFAEEDKTMVNLLRLLRSVTSYNFSSSKIMCSEYVDMNSVSLNIINFYRARFDDAGPLVCDMDKLTTTDNQDYVVAHNCLVMSNNMDSFLKNSKSFPALYSSGGIEALMENNRGDWANLMLLRAISDGMTFKDIVELLQRPMFFRAKKLKKKGYLKERIGAIMDKSVMIIDTFTNFGEETRKVRIFTELEDMQEISESATQLVVYMEKELKKNKNYIRDDDFPVVDVDHVPIHMVFVEEMITNYEMEISHTKSLSKVVALFQVGDDEEDFMRTEIIKEENSLWETENMPTFIINNSDDMIVQACTNNKNMSKKQLEKIFSSHARFNFFKKVVDKLRTTEMWTLEDLLKAIKKDDFKDYEDLRLTKEDMKDLATFKMKTNEIRFGTADYEPVFDAGVGFDTIFMDNLEFNTGKDPDELDAPEMDIAEMLRMQGMQSEEEEEEEESEEAQENAMRIRMERLENMTRAMNALDMSADDDEVGFNETFDMFGMISDAIGTITTVDAMPSVEVSATKDNAIMKFFKLCVREMSNNVLENMNNIRMISKKCLKFAEDNNVDKMVASQLFLSIALGQIRHIMASSDWLVDKSYGIFLPAYMLYLATETTIMNNVGEGLYIIPVNVFARLPMFNFAQGSAEEDFEVKWANI